MFASSSDWQLLVFASSSDWQLLVFASSSDWFIGLSPSVVIGQSDYFSFGFTTLN